MHLFAGMLEGALIGGAIGVAVGHVIWLVQQATKKKKDDQ